MMYRGINTSHSEQLMRNRVASVTREVNWLIKTTKQGSNLPDETQRELLKTSGKLISFLYGELPK